MDAITVALVVVGVLFLIVDIFLLVAFVWWKRRSKERLDLVAEQNDEQIQLMEFDPKALAKQQLWIKTSVDEDGFSIPCNTVTVQGNERQLVRKKGSKGNNTLDASKYDPRFRSASLKMSGNPRLSFELFYYFKSAQLQMSVKRGYQLYDQFNDQFALSLMLSNGTQVSKTDRVEGPNPVFNEDFHFPLEHDEISSDPPLNLRINVWTVDRYSKKYAFGFIDVAVEEVFLEHGLMPQPGKGVNTRQVERCDDLKDSTLEDTPTQMHIHLAYLSAARRINLSVSEVTNIHINALFDKNFFVKVSLKYRDEERKVYYTQNAKFKKSVKFNQSFVFHLSESPSLSIDGISISFELLANQKKMLVKPRVVGHVTVGNSTKSDRHGREHWAKIMTSPSSIPRWYPLQEDPLITKE